MKYKNLILSILFISISLVSCNKTDKKFSTEIIWDTWGVPHIYADNEEDMYYVFGWAQMQNHADLILKLYAEAQGRASEFFGEEYLKSDRLMRLFNLSDSAKAQYGRYIGYEKVFLDAFVRGLNDYAAANRDSINSILLNVLPITAIDVLAHSKRVMNIEFLGGNDIKRALHELEEDSNDITPGSNSYAIAPSKTESGNAMLVANPHLPWSEYYLFFEANLNSPGFNLYGVTLVGMPVLNIAFNNHLGWTHTVNTIDAADRYELTLKDGGYLLDEEVKLFVEKSDTIKVRQADGLLRDEILKLKYSEHGPVVGEMDNIAYALRIAGIEKSAYNAQYHKMGKSTSLAEFEEALQMMQIPMFNLIYADKDGNIMYLFNGNVPVRSEGNWPFWNGKIDGSRSDLIWDSYHQYEDLPILVNPPTGFVQNANDAPWTSTYPMQLDSDDYPQYFSPKPQTSQTTFRAQRAINLIKEDYSISFEELVDYKLNTGMEVADRFLDDLLNSIDAHPHPKALQAASILNRWNGTTNTDSRGSVLFARWFDKIDESMFLIPWDADNPVSTPYGLNNPGEAVNLLIEAATEVEEQYGSMSVTWGEVNRFRVANIEFPGNGGESKYGVFRTMFFELNESNNRAYAFHGDTFVAVVEFADTVRAEVLLSYGNATQPGNRYVGDQLQMLSQNKLRSAFLTREEVLKNMVKKEELVNRAGFEPATSTLSR